MSDDGNDDPSLMSENGDGPSLSVHDEEESLMKNGKDIYRPAKKQK